MEIYELAEKLGKALSESEDYIKLKSAEQAQAEDSDAQLLMTAFNQKRTELMMQAQKPDITKEELSTIRDTMQKETEKLMANANISNYFEAVRNFENIMNQVNGLILKHITPEQHSSCSPDGCASCSGCH